MKRKVKCYKDYCILSKMEPNAVQSGSGLLPIESSFTVPISSIRGIGKVTKKRGGRKKSVKHHQRGGKRKILKQKGGKRKKVRRRQIGGKRKPKNNSRNRKVKKGKRAIQKGGRRKRKPVNSKTKRKK